MTQIQKKDIISITIVLTLVVASVGLWWWANRPVRIVEVQEAPRQRVTAGATDLFSDPNFLELRARVGTITVGEMGNTNPFEPFAVPGEEQKSTVTQKQSAPPLASTWSCGEKACFDDAFALCTPDAWVVASLGGNFSLETRIRGPQEQMCAVALRLVESPDPSFLQKDMTCVYDQTKDFATAAEEAKRDPERCAGTLYDFLYGNP